MSTRLKKVMLIAPLALTAMVVFAFIGGQAVRLLWNWLVPSLFGLPPLTFWQALGLLALCRILFGGHGFSSSRSRTPEERERSRQAFRRRFGFARSDDDLDRAGP